MLANGRTFTAAADVTILEAARREGIVLEYSCRTGRCGVCRAGVVSGTTIVKQAEQSLDRTLGPDQILTCCRTAESDVVLDVEDLGRLAFISTQTLACRIAAIEPCAADIVQVTLRLPPTAAFEYLPGQYVDVIVAGERRSYSIANAPREDRNLELFIRRYPGGRLSEYWFDRAKVNDLLRFEGPFGTFFLRDHDAGDVIFLATGTGIAPVKALIEEMAADPARAAGRRLRVFWGNRAADDFCWNPAAPGLDIGFHPVLSGADAGWGGRRGHVHTAAVEDGFDPSGTVVYACGSDAMIASARILFTSLGLPARRFFSDAFVSSN